MDQQPQWEIPEFEPLTDSDARADQADIPIRSGGGAGSIPG